MAKSRYRIGVAPDYSHRFHAGNVGDVWKHCVLLHVLANLAAGGVSYIETHAGEGRYALGPTGEWSEGIGRLWNLQSEQPGNGAIADYVRSCHELGAGDDRPTAYPGSPLFARAALGDSARLTLFERDPQAFEHLRSTLRDDVQTHVVCDDGLAALPDAVRDAEAHAAAHRSVVVLIDPPYTGKADWIAVPDALIAAGKASTRASLLLWYPVKSLTRPNAMIARLESAGVHATVSELITTPLAHQRQRLNGSGMILVRPPGAAIESVAAAAARIGPLCATRDGAWSFRIAAW